MAKRKNRPRDVKPTEVAGSASGPCRAVLGPDGLEVTIRIKRTIPVDDYIKDLELYQRCGLQVPRREPYETLERAVLEAAADFALDYFGVDEDEVPKSFYYGSKIMEELVEPLGGSFREDAESLEQYEEGVNAWVQDPELSEEGKPHFKKACALALKFDRKGAEAAIARAAKAWGIEAPDMGPASEAVAQ